MTETLLDIMLTASIAAAEIIKDIYSRPIQTDWKSDGSPVTEADQKAEVVILNHLRTTGIPVLAEESVSAGRIPELGARFFVVDPLDGTKEFLKRNGEFTVNIALVDHGRPVLGVVLAPVTGEIFIGEPKGAYCGNVFAGKVIDTQSMRVRHEGPLRVVASRSHGHAALQSLCDTFSISQDVSVGSSLKFCLVARGDAQLYPRFTPTSEWDTAAGQAVLEAAGGVVLTLDGKPLGYGKTALNFINPYFVAASDRELARLAGAEMARLTA